MDLWGLILLLAITIVITAVIARFLFSAESKRLEKKLDKLEERLELPEFDYESRLNEWNIVIPPPDIDVAHNRAKDRINNIKNEFEKNGLFFSEKISPDSSVLKNEFIEWPPINEERSSRHFDSYSSACGQMARLLWQLRQPEYALAERVIDAIVAFRRLSSARDRDAIEYPTVKVEKLNGEYVRENKFPWVVVVETDNAESYRRFLSNISDWLGIAVAIGPPRRVNLHGACKAGVGLEGVVGGVLRNSESEVYVTCSHVLSSECQSKILGGDPSKDSNEPDAALLRSGNPCFKLDSNMVPCASVSTEEVDQHILNRRLVQKRNPECNSRKGFIRNRVHGFNVNGTFHRFPHLEIFPDISRFDSLMMPFWRRAFSKRGDSGSWVFEENSENWVGMVIGGDEYFLSTFVAESEPLLDYFTLLSRDVNIDSPLLPFIFKK